jgi:hypothetical protein
MILSIWAQRKMCSDGFPFDSENDRFVSGPAMNVEAMIWRNA